MKRLVLFAVVLLLAVPALAQKKNDNHKKFVAELAKLYPNAKDVKWHEVWPTTVAAFKYDKKNMRVGFDRDGKLTINTEVEPVSKFNVPIRMTKALAEYWKDYTILHLEKEIHLKGDGMYESAKPKPRKVTTYFAALKKGKKIATITFNENGDQIGSY